MRTLLPAPVCAGLIAAILSAGAAAQAQRCAITDPITGSCVASGREAGRAVGAHGPVEARAAPGQPYSLGGIHEGSGYYECAVFDEKTQRCRIRALSAEQRESAVQTGIEAAMSGMRIQQEAIIRAQQMGMHSAPAVAVPHVVPTPVRSTAPGGTGMYPAAPAPSNRAPDATATLADQFRDCADRRMAQISRSMNRTPTAAEQMAVVTECAK